MFVGARMVEPVWMVPSHLTVHVQPVILGSTVNVRHMLLTISYIFISHISMDQLYLLIEHSLMGKNTLNTRMAPM